jgi:hypothetical protein
MTTLHAPLSAIGLVASLFVTTAVAQVSDSPEVPNDDLRTNEALVMLDYQVIKVPGDAPIDLLGLHLYSKVREGLYIGAGAYAPHVKGEYGGFMAFDAGAHFRHRISGSLFATADLSVGGGGGGRSVEQSRVLSGTGGFAKASLGLAYDFGRFAVGAGVTRMKFRKSSIDSTQANVFMTIPYSHLTGAFSRHGEALTATDDSRADAEVGENMVTASLDNLRQIDPQGTNKGVIRTVDLQYSHFFSPDNYWFLALGVGYAGLPIYNQILGGVGRRMPLSQDLSVYAQLGMGSGGYAPALIDTGPGLLVYPKVSLEYALTRNLGLTLSVGYLSAPKASSRNQTYALALTQHFGLGGIEGGGGTSDPTRWHGLRLSAFHQTQFNVRYRALNGSNLQMGGVQVDKQLRGPWYLSMQAAVAYNDYFGYPGYGEILAGVGLQTHAGSLGPLQLFGQLMAGANVHGPGVKISGGMRYLLNDRVSLHLAAGQITTRSSTGGRFSANSLGIGLDYRFAVPSR